MTAKTKTILRSSERCYELLDETSRSFALVIHSLPGDLRDTNCILYLILRALDTIEDDMSLDKKVKKGLLCHFYKKLRIEGWTFTESGPHEKDRQLLAEFDLVIHEFSLLDAKYRKIISNITKEMGAGMAAFVDKPIQSLEDYEKYEYYVAGLVGVGLSQIWIASGLEDFSGLDNKMIDKLSISLGLFLQKTNIIRDFREDFDQNRFFWPAQVWQSHVSELKQLMDPTHKAAALKCLDELICDALKHVGDILMYLRLLKQPLIFRFCAIPQAMAMTTLVECFHNYDVYFKPVKISRVSAALASGAINALQLNLSSL